MIVCFSYNATLYSSRPLADNYTDVAGASGQTADWVNIHHKNQCLENFCLAYSNKLPRKAIYTLDFPCK